MFVSAIIAAGGRGQRFGGPVPKQLLAIDGQSALERSVALFLAHPQVDELIVALPAELVSAPPPYLRAARKPIRIVAGGGRRQDSVQNAFNAIADASELVVIHDAARPFASSDLISRTIAAAAESGAALAALPSRDTVKRSNGLTPFVSETIPRESVHLAQTPQAFTRRVLREALALGESGPDATDEAALAERAGHPVRLVEGEPTNIKITTREDLTMMESMAGQQLRPARSGRAGTGYDLHRLVAGRPLVLGGLTIPFERGALGHSDADVVCHSVTDAILGALALGDIGRHFPDDDPQWKDASSVDLLRRAVALVHQQGYQVGNVDVTVILERPKIRGYVDAMRASLAGALGVGIERVSIKGKTNEGVDAVGRGEAIAAHAVALLRRS
ncbi:MAG TPA: 2-C-methyl-D-erythritol 4-phosphate cytidylyltransferase [Vicinamibacterales bacterium]|nr:2-C-methyl-D-erythritol 4-phosphate cytidylyltransferase [Vicinamibacterales bacterium]